jgi:hypothetical protein
MREILNQGKDVMPVSSSHGRPIQPSRINRRLAHLCGGKRQVSVLQTPCRQYVFSWSTAGPETNPQGGEGHTQTGKAACLDDLRRRILTQELEPGAYLDETQLAEGYAISRPPLARGAAATGR